MLLLFNDIFKIIIQLFLGCYLICLYYIRNIWKCKFLLSLTYAFRSTRFLISKYRLSLYVFLLRVDNRFAIILRIFCHRAIKLYRIHVFYHLSIRHHRHVHQPNEIFLYHASGYLSNGLNIFSCLATRFCQTHSSNYAEIALHRQFHQTK